MIGHTAHLKPESVHEEVASYSRVDGRSAGSRTKNKHETKLGLVHSIGWDEHVHSEKTSFRVPVGRDEELGRRREATSTCDFSSTE